MKKLALLLLTVALLLLLMSCAGNKADQVRKLTKPIKIAILPFANETTDLGVSELARIFFIIGLEEKGYTVLNMDETDKILQENGITEGGQLSSISASELQKKLNTEGLLYGTVIDAQYSTLAIAAKKKVTIKIIVKQNEAEVWNDQESVSQSALSSLANPLQGLAEQVVNKTFEKAFAKYHGHPLEAFTEEVCYKLQEKMPGTRVEKSGWN